MRDAHPHESADEYRDRMIDRGDVLRDRMKDERAEAGEVSKHERRKAGELAIKGEGEIQTVVRVRARKRCEMCDGLAKYRHTFLLEGMRSNPASQAYGMDDCSYCVDAETFACGTCKPDIPAGYVQGSRYECTDRWAHLFLQWEELDPADGPVSWECGCGHTNGINLATCAVCDRKPGEGK